MDTYPRNARPALRRPHRARESSLRRPPVWWRETIRGRWVTSLLMVEVRLPADTDANAHALARNMALHYFNTLPDSCGGLVRASSQGPSFASPDDASPPGPACGYDLHPAATGRVPLLRMGPPRVESAPHRTRLVYPVIGGLLAGPPAAFEDGVVDRAAGPPAGEDRGTFTFEAAVDGSRATFSVAVEQFPARILGSGRSFLCRWVYLGTESLVHRLLVSRFLRGFVERLSPERAETP